MSEDKRKEGSRRRSGGGQPKAGGGSQQGRGQEEPVTVEGSGQPESEALPKSRGRKPDRKDRGATMNVQFETVEASPSQRYYIDTSVLGLAADHSLPALLKRNDFRLGLMMTEIIGDIEVDVTKPVSAIAKALVEITNVRGSVREPSLWRGFLDAIIGDSSLSRPLHEAEVPGEGMSHQLLPYVKSEMPVFYGCMIYAYTVGKLPTPKVPSSGGDNVAPGTDLYGSARDSYLQVLKRDPFDEAAVLRSIFSPKKAFAAGTSRDVLREILSTAINSKDDTYPSPFAGAAREMYLAFNLAEEVNTSTEYGYFSEATAYYSCLVAASEATRLLPTLRIIRKQVGSSSTMDPLKALTDLSGYSVLTVVRNPLQNFDAALSAISLSIIDTLAAITFASVEPTLSLEQLLTADAVGATADTCQHLVSLASFHRLVIFTAHERGHVKIQQEDVVRALERWISYHVNDRAYVSGVGTLETLNDLSSETVKAAFSMASATASISSVKGAFRTLSVKAPRHVEEYQVEREDESDPSTEEGEEE